MKSFPLIAILLPARPSHNPREIGIPLRCLIFRDLHGIQFEAGVSKTHLHGAAPGV